MALQRIRVGDVGTVIRLRVLNETGAVEDLSGTSLKQIVLTAPDRTSRALTAAFTTSGTDGMIQYTTVANDINQIGRWQARALYELAAGAQHYTSEPLNFDVAPSQ